MAKTKTAPKEVSVEDVLRALYNLQQIDSEIDKIRTVRGELPLEVEDLEDEIEGLATRVQKLDDEVKEFEGAIADRKNAIKEAKAAVKKYQGQQDKVRNNREFDSLTKEIEYQNLDIQLSEKRIKEAQANIEAKGEVKKESDDLLKERMADLDLKKKELEEIVAETQKEEESLAKKSAKAQNIVEERLVNAYQRIRKNARNGLAVVTIQRDACGGCFNKIPPQRQLDIKMHKKIIVCEHCGRILVDEAIND